MTTEQRSRLAELHPLEDGEGLRFADWPGDAPPPMASRGVYTLWKGEQLLYVGLAGLGPLPEKKPKKPWGLRRRLEAHAAGRRAGDTVSCLIADRFVLDALEEEELDAIVAGDDSMDSHIKAWVDEHLTYRFVHVETTAVARDLQQRVRQGELNAGPPLLNPFLGIAPTPPPPPEGPAESADVAGPDPADDIPVDPGEAGVALGEPALGGQMAGEE